MWRVGELAKKMGVTVRTLHHYDAIGLLKPSARSDSGYRLYASAEVVRLGHITMLRQLGLGLEDIAACLDAGETTLTHTLSQHIERMRAELEAQRAVLSRLEVLATQLSEADEASIEHLDTLMEVMTMLETYYTPEQLEQLETRRQALGEDAIQEVQREWEEVFAGFKRAFDAGLPVEAPEPRALAERSLELIAMFTGGNAGIERSLNTMYANEGGPEVLSAHGGYPGLDAELWGYMQRAREALTP